MQILNLYPWRFWCSKLRVGSRNLHFQASQVILRLDYTLRNPALELALRRKKPSWNMVVGDSFRESLGSALRLLLKHFEGN